MIQHLNILSSLINLPIIKINYSLSTNSIMKIYIHIHVIPIPSHIALSPTVSLSISTYLSINDSLSILNNFSILSYLYLLSHLIILIHFSHLLCFSSHYPYLLIILTIPLANSTSLYPQALKEFLLLVLLCLS